MGSTRVPRVVAGVPPDTSAGAKYARRRLPHFERPWAKYHITFATADRRQLSERARDIVLESLLHLHRERRYQMYAACIMPEHVHLLIEPQIRAQSENVKPVFWSLSEIMHSIKSFTAHEINKAEGKSGIVWEKESMDRMIRSDADLSEKFHYICANPWQAGVADPAEDYNWLWTPDVPRRDAGESTRDACATHAADASGKMPDAAGWKSALPQEEPAPSTDEPALPEEKTAPRISGEFAFKLYDTYGFPLDLTELMARERGLTVDTVGFEKLMAEQKARARAAQKKAVIEVAQVEVGMETMFIGYDQLETPVKVQEVLHIKGRTAVILDTTACYAEMGGQVGDRGELDGHGQLWRIEDTQKVGQAWLHFLETGSVVSSVARANSSSGSAGLQPAASGILPDASSADKMSADAAKMAALPVPGDVLTLTVDVERRRAIQRHHTASHLLHWALHEVVSPEAAQKGSYVGPEKLTFDFSSAALTPAQLVELERAVNARILDNAPVSWQEKPYTEIQAHKEIRQFFGEKYGDTVRVVQIGGQPGGLDGWSMELCGGTHVRATGDIGQFRIVAESSVAAGIRRIEAVCGWAAWEFLRREHELLHAVAQRLSLAPEEVPGRVAALLDNAKKLEKEIKQRAAESALGRVDELMAKAQTVAGVPLIAADAGELDADALRSLHAGIRAKRPDDLIVLGSAADGKAFFIASASAALVQRGVHCGKLIGAVAKLAGGGGGGRPDNAQAGGKEPAKVPAAIAQVAELVAQLSK
ncbi:MAG: alanine--tRNA ligase-related protein [Kiritimatiellaeota bacterium]|nr:alanine--tRNA ligase-related protein [Kiritimatiellota bacterium]